MNEINISDMKTIELTVDQVGRVYFYQNRVFRAINDDYIDQVMDIFNNGLIEEITNKGLFPKTWISDMHINGYALVIEHEKITNWNYPYEWSFDMLKDAGLLVLQINNIANKYGYQIMDGHSSNVVFNKNKPQYIDFGSFIKFNKDNNSSWASYNTFYNHFYITLYLWSKGYPDIARNIFLMRDYFSEKEFLKLKHPIVNVINSNYVFEIMGKITTLALSSENKVLDKITNTHKQKLALFLSKLFKKRFTVNKLKNDIGEFNKPTEFSMWNDYHDEIDPKTNKRLIRLTEIINTLSDTMSLTELGSNQGKFSEFVLSNTHLKNIIATDYDKEAVNIMYLNNKNTDNFLPLLFDMVRTNGRKYDEYIHNRIRSDIVMALAVTHHLILTQQIPIDFIFNMMRKLTNKYIIIEFMPIGLYAGDVDNIPALPDFYSLKWFKDNFMNNFDLILDEKIEMNRHVFVGKLKKENN